MEEIHADIRTNGGRVFPGSRSVFIDLDDLHNYDSQIETKLLNNPISALRKLSDVLNEVFIETYSQEVKDFKLNVRLNINQGGPRSGFEDMDASKIGKLIALRGVITMITTKMPSGKVMVFRCPACNAERKIEYNDFLPYSPPPKSCPVVECPSHSSRTGTAWEFEVFESRYTNFQSIIVQEGPEMLGATDQPKMCKIVLTEDLVEMLKPGSRVTITGVLMATPGFKVYQKSFDPPVMRYHVHCTGLKNENPDKSISETMTEERRQEVMSLIRSYEGRFDAYFDFLASGVAPMIYGHKWVKYAMLLALIGAQLYVFPGNTHSRRFIHVLIIGDPGIAKTRILKSLEYLVKVYRYATGNQVTQAGLTAAAIPGQNGVPELHIGAAVMADTGILAVDEFNQLRVNDKPAFLEFMETGLITIDKYGFHEKLNARATVVAAANPSAGRVNMTPSKIKDNFKDIYPPLLNRFDFIFLIPDDPDPERDGPMVDQMLSSRDPKYVKTLKIGEGEEVLPSEEVEKMTRRVSDIRDIIAVTRKLADENPLRISEEGKQMIKAFYMEKRAGMLDNNKKVRYDIPIKISPRQLEALSRASEGFAILRASKTVDPVDILLASKVLNESMKETMIDEDGNEDAAQFDSEKSHAEVSKENLMISALDQMQKMNEQRGRKYKDGVEMEDFKEFVMDQTKNMTEDLFKEHFKKLLKRAFIEEYQGTKVRITERGKKEI